jgi:hypothetical protein
MSWSPSVRNPFSWALVRLVCSNYDGTQLVDVLVILLPHLVLVRETFDAHLQKLRLGAAKELRSAREMRQWWRRKDNELVNSNSPTIPFIKLPDEGTWAETWRKKRKRLPTNGQEKL